MEQIPINADRLIRDLKHLRSIGAVGTGVVRPAFSASDMHARSWLKERFKEANLEATIDGVANVFGRSRMEGPALLIGSHSDTQPEGGWLDGALGVVYGLEVARSLAENDKTKHMAIDVVSWQDEESNFLSCLGSRSWCGTLNEELEKTATSREGEKLRDALTRVGLNNTDRLLIEEDRYVGYLEAHIEQGNYLEDAGEKIGIVTAIVGIRAFIITFRGEQNHAGTTTMQRRKDAATAMFEAAHRINQEFPSVVNENTVWTIGNAVIEPGASSIVPGLAELTLQFRDQDEKVLDLLEGTVEEIISDIRSRGVISVDIRPGREVIKPSKMHAEFQMFLEESARLITPNSWRYMPSAAGHDPMVIHEKLPCGMLFIPSIGGISHNFKEDSHETDIILGCEVLATGAAAILKKTGT
ncbi:MAG: Zn-dependent hydrolase [Rhodospirillaceae bacterium]|nr:Zn-dependent hydrolase [Rhodospirillaceae bacterium]|tara:strand:- start:1254 stop:2492 length:1239 start_codon:yes stop_codon:yes gene_type:complete